MGPLALVIATMGGAWTAHILEYLRVWGAAGYGSVVSSSVHAYMGPVGVVLVVTGGAACAATGWVATRLERHVANARSSPRSPRRSDAGGYRGTVVVSVTTLLGALWVCQLAVYVAQENLEARAEHVAMPGPGVLSGPHAFAPVVHLMVAALIAGLLYVTRRRVTRLARELRELGRRFDQVGYAAVAAPAGRPCRAWTPAERWGAQRWSRPPPLRSGC